MVGYIQSTALLNKLYVLELANSGRNIAAISSQTNQSVGLMERTLRNRNGIVKCSTPKAKRRYLQFRDRLWIRHLADSGEPQASICEKFEIWNQTYHRTLKMKSTWIEQANGSSALTVKRILYVWYPQLDSELDSFVTFGRNIRLPVTHELLQERAKMIDTSLGITDFRGING